ncbi:MAG: class IV adenylate cyclase [Alphaproteobacteria bacterium]|nr:class IV adenylate cyclase [Alphaproteobacteria bacterium]
MAHENIEIEVKFALTNPDTVIAWLEKNAKFEYESRQIDEYFNAPHRNFFGRPTVDDWLRIREESNGKKSVNYKHWHQTVGNSSWADEWETEIASPADMRNILLQLQFEPVIKVDKRRKTFKLGATEFSIDQVEGLGFFIEAEYCGPAADKDAIKVELIEKIKSIGAAIGEPDTRGYPYWLLERKGYIKQQEG